MQPNITNTNKPINTVNISLNLKLKLMPISFILKLNCVCHKQSFVMEFGTFMRVLKIDVQLYN